MDESCPSRPSGLDNDFGGLWWTVNRVHGIQRVSDRIGFMSLRCRSAAQGAGQRRMTEDLLRFRGERGERFEERPLRGANF